MKKKGCLQVKIRLKGRLYFFIPVFIALFLSLMLPGCESFLSGIFEKTAKKGVQLEDRDVGGLKETQLREIIREEAKKIDKEAKDARVDEQTWEVHSEVTGRKVNVEKTLESILAAEEGENVKLYVEKIKPKVLAAQLEANIVEIADYSSPLLNKGESRVNNIELAASRINYKKLDPGEEFSFNRTVGKRTEAKGYEEAPIIIRTEDGPKKGYGVGGGVCQLSSTIYNAVEECGLEVTERHLHSIDVGYVPEGEDATVAYGEVDFRFKNTRNHPIMLRVYVTDERVTVRILENRNS